MDRLSMGGVKIIPLTAAGMNGLSTIDRWLTDGCLTDPECSWMLVDNIAKSVDWSINHQQMVMALQNASPLPVDTQGWQEIVQFCPWPVSSSVETLFKWQPRPQFSALHAQVDTDREGRVRADVTLRYQGNVIHSGSVKWCNFRLTFRFIKIT